MSNISQKLTYLNETKSLIKDGINDLGGNIDNETTFREYVDNLTEIYNDYPKVSDIGTEITLTNTKHGKLTTELNPTDISQESTTGKNLLRFPYNSTTGSYANVNIIVNDDGSLSVNGTGNGTGYFNFSASSTKQLLKAGTYTLSLQEAGIEMTVTTGTETLAYISAINTVATFTISEDTDVVIYLAVRANKTYDLLVKPQLELGSTATSWEKPTNGPAPNPDYPFPIHTVNGENNIIVENKNLFDVEEFEEKLVSGKILNDSGVEINDTGSAYSKYMIFLEANKTYYIKGYFQRIYYFNENKIFKSRSGGTFNLRSFSYTPTENEYLEFQIHNTTWETNKGEEQIEFGSTATSYVSHQEQNYSINLGNLEYCKKGTYANKIFKNTSDDSEYDSGLNENERYMKKNIKKIVLDGTENWVLNSNYQGKYRYTLELNDLIYYDNNNGTEVSALSDYFKGVPTNEWSTTVNSITVISNKRLLISSEINNVTDFKTWLITHNTEVYYVLNTPQYINITENYPTLATQLENLSKAKSYDDETNISQTNNDLPFEINIKALMKGE